MKEVIEEDEPFLSRKRFEETWKILKSTKKEKYKFLFNAGPDIKEAIFPLFKVVWETEECPTLWEKTKIIQIFKGKSEVEDIKGYRNIHLKEEIGKMFRHILVSKLKDRLTGNMSIYQTAKPGHRSEENLFVVKSLMMLKEKYKEPLILQLMDLETFFDKECLIDVLDAAYSNNIKGKEYRLLYNLNKKREITVLTAVGESKPEEVDEGISQGTIDSGPLSAASTDTGLMTFFKSSPYEIYYNNKVRLQGIRYQDDIFRASTNINDTQAGIAKLEAMAETKIINFNEKKSCLVVVGNRTTKELIEKELKSKPVMLYGKPMMQKSQEKYLGDELTGNTAESIEATIRKRKGNALQTISEISAIVSDARADAIGGISIAIDVWELAVIPYLLNNAGTWMGMSKKAIEMLNQIQKVFLQRILQVKTAAIPLMFWDLGQLLMSNRVLKKKLLLVHHLATLNKKSIGYQIYYQQKKDSLPGLIEEMKEDLLQFEMTLDGMETFTKKEWKKFTEKNVRKKNREDLLTMMKSFKKLEVEELEKEDDGIKPYMKSLSYRDAVLKFKMRARVIKTVKTHFKNDKNFTSELWSCLNCSSLDTSFHILHQCPIYENLRKDINIDNDEEVVDFFRKVIQRREEKEDDGRETNKVNSNDNRL